MIGAGRDEAPIAPLFRAFAEYVRTQAAFVGSLMPHGGWIRRCSWRWTRSPRSVNPAAGWSHALAAIGAPGLHFHDCQYPGQRGTLAARE
jgi:hypothetical protein